MAKINKNNKEEKEILRHMPDDERVKDEYWRLRKCYSGISGNKLKIVLKLIARAAFMAVTLEDLEKYISEHGCTEEYQNGENQYGRKKNPAVADHRRPHRGRRKRKLYHSRAERAHKPHPRSVGKLRNGRNGVFLPL